jgi:hypothetical protein
MRWLLPLCCLCLLTTGCPDDTKTDAASGPSDASSGSDRAGVDASASDRAGSDVVTDAAGSDAWVLACPADDSYEPNNSAASAAALPHPGPYRGQMIACDSDDWYAITVPAGFGVAVQLTFTASVNLDLELFETASPTTPIDTSAGLSGAESVYHELFEAATPILIHVHNGSLPATTAYQLTLTFYQNGLCASDTLYEPNNTAQTAAAVTVPATLSNLMGCDAEDWYSFSVPANDGLSVELNHDPAEANLDLYLYTASDPTTALASRTDYAPRKLVTYELFAAATPVLVRVNNSSYPGPRASYSLAVQFWPGGYCLDDNSEPNDDAGSAAAVASGQSGVLCRDNVDYWQFTLAEPGPNSRVVITSERQLDLLLSVAGDTTPVATAVEETTVDGHRYTFTFTSVASTTYVVRVAKAVGVTQVAVAYSFAAIKGTPPANDTCATAIAATIDADFTGSNKNAVNDVEFASGSASCVGNRAIGPDVFYTLTVPAGQAAIIQLTGAPNFEIYLIDDCSSHCCYGGRTIPAGATSTILNYYNDGASDQALLLGVDGRGAGSESSFTLKVQFGGGSTPDGGSGCRADQALDGGSAD